MGLEAIFKGWMGELQTKFINYLFLGESYKVFNNVILRDDRGSTQIDHVIVSKYGIFAIETKDKDGWIFGSSDQEQWTQVLFNNRFKFQNPLRQNYRHSKALSSLLGIDHNKVHSIIIFWGNCEFKNQMPNNVFKGGLFNIKYRQYIENISEVVLNQDEITRICSYLSNTKENQGLLGDVNHVLELKEKFGTNSLCPKCGAKLVKRLSNKGQRAGQTFLGCSNYPRCHYIKEL